MGRKAISSFLASGAVVVAAAAFLGFAVAQTGQKGMALETLNAAFSSSDGLVVGSTVEVAGVKVGEVTFVGVSPNTFLSDVTFRIDRRLRLPADSRLAIQAGGLAGSAVLAVEPGTSPTPLRSGETITRTSSAASLEHEVGTFIFGGGGLAESE